MAVTVPPEVDWLLDILVGQSWPQGDEDALRRCAQAWMDAMLAVGGLADHSDLTSMRVHANAEAASADDFKKFWDHYISNDANLTGTGTFPGLFGQFEEQAKALVGQANEVEYTKLIIVITLILTAIQIAWAIASAVMTLGGSLTEIPFAMLIGRQCVVAALGRFVQMALMMIVPDLIAQGVLLAQNRGWDWNKTLSAGENALAAGVIASFLGAGAARLPWMADGMAESAGGKISQLLTHFVEGGLVNDSTLLTTAGVNYAIADLTGNKDAMAQYSQELTAGNLMRQFLQGGTLATLFYLPHLAAPHGTPMSFTAADGSKLQVLLGRADLAAFDANGHQVPGGTALTVYDASGHQAGTATFDGSSVTVDYRSGGSQTIDLTGQGYTVAGHDGTLTTYGFGADGRPQVQTYAAPSDGSVVVQVSDGQGGVRDLTVPAGSMVRYDGQGSPYRADVADGSTVTSYQTATPGEPLEVTGMTVHSRVPVLSGVFGVEASTSYGPDGPGGDPLAHTNWLTGHTNYPDAGASYQQAFADRYLAAGPGDHAPTSAAGTVTPVAAQPGAEAMSLAGPRPDQATQPPAGQDQVTQDLSAAADLAAGSQLLALMHASDLVSRGAGPAGGSDPELLSDILDTQKLRPQPEFEAEYENGRLFIKELRSELPPDTPADIQRHERLAAASQRFHAEHPSVAAAGDQAQGDMPAWLDGEPGKILLVTTEWARTKGGIPVFNQELAMALAQQGHEVYVAVLDENIPPGQEHPIAGVTLVTHVGELPAQVDLIIGHARFTGLQAQELRENFYDGTPLVHVQHMAPEGLGEVKAGGVVYRAPRVSEYDEVVITGEVDGVTVGRLVQRDFSADYGIARLEDQMVVDGKPITVGHAVFKEFGKGAANSEAEQVLGQRADIALGVGPAITQDVIRLVGGAPTPLVREVIPGLDFSRVVTQPELDDAGRPADGQYNVLLIGRADEAQKGAHEAARMVGQLNAAGMNVRLTIRGFDPAQAAQIPAVEQQLSEIAGGARVTVLPFTSDAAELDADLSSAHLVIAPGSGEGFGMSAAGAAAVGVPVLVPDSSGFGAFLADPQRITVDTGDMLVHQGFADQIPVDAWTAKMSEIFHDLPGARAQASELASQLRAQGRTWAGTVDSVLGAVRDLYRARAAHPAEHPGGPGGPDLTQRSIADILNPPALTHPGTAFADLPDGLTPVEPPPGMERLAGMLYRSPAGLACYDGSDPRMFTAAAHVHSDGSSFVADMHGGPGWVRAGSGVETALSPEDLRQVLLQAGWDGRQRIVLLACDTGRAEGGAESYAAALARVTGVEVIAPTERVWQSAADNHVFIAGARWDEATSQWLPATARPGELAGEPGPGEPPAESRPGQWVGHDPSGTTHQVAADEYGMPVPDRAEQAPQVPGPGHDDLLAAGLAGEGSAHSPPADLVFRGDEGAPLPVVTNAACQVSESGEVTLTSAIPGTKPWVLEIGDHREGAWDGGQAADIFSYSDAAVRAELIKFPGTMDAVLVHDPQRCTQSIESLGDTLRPGGVLVLEDSRSPGETMPLGSVLLAARNGSVPDGYRITHSDPARIVISKLGGDVAVAQAARPAPDIRALIAAMRPPQNDPRVLPSPLELEQRWGITQHNQKLFQFIADKYGLAIDVRPTNPESVPLLEAGGVPKPPAIKMKTINALDVLLGAPEMIGAVGFFKPVLPGRDEIPPELWAAVEKRFNQRSAEYDEYLPKVEHLILERKFQVADGVVYPFTPFATRETAGRYDTLMVGTPFINTDGEPQAAPVFSEGPGGRMLEPVDLNPAIDARLGPPVTGDHDMFDIRTADGQELPYDRPQAVPGYPEPRVWFKKLVDEYYMTQDQVRGKGIEAGEMLALPMGVQHGAMRVFMRHEFIPAWEQEHIFDPIIVSHLPGREPLIRFQAGRPPMLVNALTPVEQLLLASGPGEPLLLAGPRPASEGDGS